MKAFITKYALSSGIKEIEVIQHQDDPPDIFVWGGYVYREGREWHRTKEEAVARAETMRVKRIASLEKQLAKLRVLTFD